MPSFVYPALVWGLLIAGVPVLIHLINLLRHRRVRWAAMEFLLASQKRNRTRVLLKQLLLLMVRMLAIAAVVMVLAEPLLRSRLGSLLGGSTTEFVGYNYGTTTVGLGEITDYMRSTVQSCAGHGIIRAWSGFRPHATDGVIRLGPHAEGPEGYYTAAGHDSGGVALSPTHCRCLAQFIAQGACTPTLEELVS